MNETPENSIIDGSTRRLISELETTDSISRRDTLIRKIEDTTQFFASSLIKDKYHGWWAWEYYEEENSACPLFSTKGNLDENFIYFYVSLNPIFGRVSVNGNMETINLCEKMPIDWLDAKNEEQAQTLITNAINEYNLHEALLKQEQAVQRARERARKQCEADLKEEIRKETANTFTDEQKWAFGIDKFIQPPPSILLKLKLFKQKSMEIK